MTQQITLEALKTATDIVEGELYAGISIDENGVACHVVLLPGEKTGVNFAAANKWAASIGGTLPTRREQSLLFANLKENFQSRAYWSCEQHAGYSGSAWGQYFSDGSQYYWDKDVKLCARAVRKLPI